MPLDTPELDPSPAPGSYNNGTVRVTINDMIEKSTQNAPDTSVFGSKGGEAVDLVTVGNERDFTWSSDTTATAPPAGGVKGNNATLSAITEIYIDSTTSAGIAFGELLKLSAENDTGLLSGFEQQGNAIFFRFTAPAVDNGTWFTVPVSVESSGGTFTDGEILSGEYWAQGHRPQRILAETLLSSGSSNDQNPTTTDTALPVEFGPATGGSGDPVQLSAAGEITINESGTYTGVFFLQVGRSGSSGTSQIWIRFLVNGAQPSPSLRVELNGPDDDIPVTIPFTSELSQTDVVTVEILRDSAGNNSGGLIAASPTLAGWNDSTSATVRIYRSNIIGD